MHPKIGIIVCGIQDERQFVSNSYIQAIIHASGLPIVIPMIKGNHDEYLSMCDGFLFCGGGDITPLLFKQEPTQGLGETDLAFDLFQLKMMKAILNTQKPLLSICRSMQILNVACNGTLIQDLKTKENIINHMQTSHQRSDVSHKVIFAPNTLLHQIMKNSTYTNSYHHQAIDQLGRDLIISGQSSDGIIEAIEMPSHPFVVGVQWHPECMFHTSSKMRNLFHTFIHYSR